jgi:ubiquinone/menaquinone biosynthesis C-methylase UbiE
MNRTLAEKAVREAYEDPETVARYAGQPHLLTSERLLVGRFFPTGGNLLDLGCGAGRTTIPLALGGFHVLGMDLSHGMLRAATMQAAEVGTSIRFLQMDARALAYSNESFDGALFSYNAMDDVPGYSAKLQVLREVKRVLRRGAPFIFSAHSIWTPFRLRSILRGGLRLYLGRILGLQSPEQEWGELYNWNTRDKEEHYGHFMTPKRWLAILREAGFDLVGLETRRQIEGLPFVQGVVLGLRSRNDQYYIVRRPA